MTSIYVRVRAWLLTTSAGGLFVLESCGLSDQQLASVWQSVITSALSTIATNILSAGTANGA